MKSPDCMRFGHVDAVIQKASTVTIDLTLTRGVGAELSLTLADTSEKIFATTITTDGTAQVTFGDGEPGKRLPTGRPNIMATYRSGAGLSGDVDPGSVTTLLSKPLDLKAVNNPLPSSGGADPEELNEARANAPKTSRRQDRAVTTADFEAVAPSNPGVSRANATWVYEPRPEGVFAVVGRVFGEGSKDVGVTSIAIALATREEGGTSLDVVVLDTEIGCAGHAITDPDLHAGSALRDLLSVLERELTTLKEDLDDIYDSAFVETAGSWAVPYIGLLIGREDSHQARS